VKNYLGNNVSATIQPTANVSNVPESSCRTRSLEKDIPQHPNHNQLPKFPTMLTRVPQSTTPPIHILQSIPTPVVPAQILESTEAETLRLYEIHKRIFENQRTAFKFQKDNGKSGEITIVGDFKQNLAVGGVGPVEVGNDYFSRTQVSCLGFAIYIGGTGENGKPFLPIYFDFLSYILSHNAVYVKDCIDILLSRIANIVNYKKVHFWFDAGKHFRNAELCHHLVTCKALENIPFDVNYFAEHHGKSPVDAHFSQLSTLLKQAAQVQTINNIDDLSAIYNKKFNIVIYKREKQQESIKKIKLLNSSNGKVNLGDFYSFGVDERKRFFVSTLSGDFERIICNYTTITTKDKRTTKFPPNLEIVSRRVSTDKVQIFPRNVATRLKRVDGSIGVKKGISKKW